MTISRQFVYLYFFCLGGSLSAAIRGPLASGQPGVYVTVAPAYPEETVVVSALVNGRRASLLGAAPVSAAGDAYLPLDAPLQTGDCIQIQQDRQNAGQVASSLSREECVVDPYDFGRLRYYFTGGALVSKARSDFSKTDLFVSFSLDKNYLLSNRVRLNTYFDTRLTAIPVAERAAADVDGFLATRKAASLQIGLYLPVTTSQWRSRDGDYSLFVAPLARAGFATPADTSGATIVNPNKFFTSYGFGGRLGHFREFKKANGETDTSIAPELLSSVDIVVGRFGNFEIYRDQTPILQAQRLLSEKDTTPGWVRKRLYRLDVEGMLTIPGTPFLIGFSANIALGRQHEPGFSLLEDDLKFLFGARFDARRLVQKLSELK